MKLVVPDSNNWNKMSAKKMTEVKLSLLHSNIWNNLTVCKINELRFIKKLSTKCVYKSYISYIYV